jgi:hypothetical protein
MVRQAHIGLARFSKETAAPLPRNSSDPDRLVRKLDCAVIRFLHAAREAEGDEAFDTIRPLRFLFPSRRASPCATLMLYTQLDT